MRSEPAAELRVGLLGPLVVRRAAGAAELPEGRVRSLFAALALAAGEPVPIEDLADQLWVGDRRPGHPRAALHSLARRLRQTLADPVVQTVNDGYRLAVAPAQVDAHRFRSLVTAASSARRSGDTDRERLLLREGLALWRGPALAGITGLAEAAATLDAERRAAFDHVLGLEQDTGRLDQVVTELRELVTAYPTHEPFRYQLVLALTRLGRADDAIAEHAAGAVALAAGADGPTSDYLSLRDTIRARPATTGAAAVAADGPVAGLETPAGVAGPEVLDGSAAYAPVPVPRQLPPDLVDFVGRAGELAALLPWLREPAGPTGVRVAVVSGAPGAGKTTFAVHAAHLTADRFPDGQLHADLHGYSAAAPSGTAQLLGRFLRALGVPDAQLPADVDELTALYRTVLADRRILLLLDNAAGAEQVLPLLPAGPGCAVLVTSRSRLRGLTVTAAARPIILGPLHRDESRRLFAAASGLTGPLPAIDELAALCADTPLALRLAAAHLAGGTPGDLAGYVNTLREDRLGALDTGDGENVGVAAAFTLSYRALPGPSRRLFGLLGLVPVRTWDADAAAALLDSDTTTARRLLRHLTAVSLLSAVPAVSGVRERFRVHDLLWWYAAERVADEEPAAERTAAHRRLAEWAVRVTSAAVRLVHPDLELEVVPVEVVAPQQFGGADTAARWLDAERDNLLVLLEHTAATRPELVWPLPALLHPHLSHGARREERQLVTAATLRAAEATGDRRVLCAALRWRGSDALQTGDLAVARDSLTAAGDVAEELGDLVSGARVANGLAIVDNMLARSGAAEAGFRRALELQRQVGSVLGQATALLNIGVSAWYQARFADAERASLRALGMLREVRSRRGQAVVLTNLASDSLALGRPEEALSRLRAAAGLTLAAGGERPEVDLLLTFAAAELAVGDTDAALGHARQALADVADSNSRPERSQAEAVLSRVHLARGETGRALELARRALATARADNLPHEQVAGWLAVSRATAAHGDGAEALDAARRAVARLRGLDLRVRHAEALLALATARRATGHPSLARRFARAAAAEAGATGQRPMYDEAQRLLAEPSP